MLERRIAAVAIAVATVTAPASRALADDKRSVLIVPLEGRAEGDLADAPARLTVALEKAAANAGLDGVLAQVSRDELAAVAGCADDSLDCLLEVAETLGATSVVIGEIRARNGGGLEITLSIAARGAEPRTATFAAIGANLAAVEATFETKATAFLNGEAIPEDPVPEPTEPTDLMPDPTGISDPTTDSGFSLGRVEGYSWGVAGGGLAIAATGVVFLGIANGKQSDVDGHPTDTVEDLEALADLEDDGKRYNRLGNAMLVVGGIATVVGIVLIVNQGRGAPEERKPGVSITPVPLRGGAGVVITCDGWSW